VSWQALALVQRFEGHSSAVVAFDWRQVDGLFCQLVSLDRSHHLRLWRVDPAALKAIGHAGRPPDDEGVEPAGPLALGDGPPLASKLSLDALKADLGAGPMAKVNQPTLAPVAVSVWQEMIEVTKPALPWW
jgi:hypothetical protein